MRCALNGIWLTFWLGESEVEIKVFGFKTSGLDLLWTKWKGYDNDVKHVTVRRANIILASCKDLGALGSATGYT